MRMSISLRKGAVFPREELIKRLVDIQYQRNDYEFSRGIFRVRGDIVEIFPMNAYDRAVRVEYFDDEIESLSEVNAVTGIPAAALAHAVIFPATHYATGKEKIESALEQIEQDMKNRVDELKAQSKLVEAQRLEQRTYIHFM